MGTLTSKIYTPLLQLSIIALTSALVWFAFIYYPKVINNYKTGNIKSPVIKPTSANNLNFPIETSAYKITYQDGNPQIYYIFIEGKNLDLYVVNKNSAELALKSALSLEKLCGLNIIYVSTQNLKVPQLFQGSSDCR